MRYQDEKLYTGSLRQLFDVRESRLIGGKADGVHVVDIHNGGELERDVCRWTDAVSGAGAKPDVSAAVLF